MEVLKIKDIEDYLKALKRHEYWMPFSDMTGRKFVVYDFYTMDGNVFNCTAQSLEIARSKRDIWLRDIYNN